MRLLMLNPNATAAMTETIVAGARRALGPGAEVVGLTNHAGPPAIEGAADGEAAVPGVLAILAAAEGFDAAVIACFDDTGLVPARATAPFPVVGLGEAGYMTAALCGPRFSVVTTVRAAIPVLEGNLKAYGLAARCVRVRAADVRVLDLEHRPDAAAEAVQAEVERAFSEDDPASVVLGCAGMTGLAERLSRGSPRRIVDCVRAAALMAQAAVGAQIKGRM